MASLRLDDSGRAGWWLGHGAIAGVLAGAAFLAFEIAVAVLTLGASWALFPLRMIAGILLGGGAVDTGSALLPVAIAGMLVHVTLSAAFGVLFASLVQRGRRTSTMLPGGAAYGFALWLLNFYVVAPLAGWHWFARDTNPVIQLVAHVAVYGLFLGSYLDRLNAAVRTVSPGTRVPRRIDRRGRPAA